MEKTIKEVKEIAEMGEFHNEDCCVNFPEDNRACDVGIGTLECCENMRALKSLAEKLVVSTIEYLSYDIFDNDEQRKAGVKMYVDNFVARMKEENI